MLLAGVQLANAIGTSADYRRLTQVAELVQRVGVLSHELGKERSLTAWYVADKRRPRGMVQLRAERQKVDSAKQRVMEAMSAIDASHSARVLDEVAQIRRWLTGLDGLRANIVGDSVPPRAAIRTFSSMIAVLLNLQDDLGDGVNDDRLQGDVAALTALSRAKEEVSRQQVILVVALVERKLDYDDLSDFLGSWNTQQAMLATFDQEAETQDRQAYRQVMRGPDIDRADAMRQRALAQLREYKEIRDLDVTNRSRAKDLDLWYRSTDLQANAMRKVEDGLATRIVAQTRDLSDTEQRNAIISGALILVLLLLVLVITTRVAGSLVRPLRRLRAEALQVATTRLPETVRVLRESGDGAAIPDVPSVGVNTRDEIGEVARAFDEVHREAIRLAGDEAKLRANVNAMFVNLSRRSQTLVERQLQLIEGLEQGEEDEQRLSNLFRLDHLATRMRRNSENLLVLAGQEAARKWSEPVPLVDIARASLSEVENYERVQIQIPSGIMIAGPAVTDAVHLLAELIENSISFSPRESKVQVTSSPIEGGVMVTINDLGIGMTGEELGEANWRLANPPVVDVAVSRRMGLFVVGRLALRHGIRVQLRMRETGGLSALVMMPDMLISQPGGTVPQQRGQYDSFTNFDPSMFGEPQGLYSAPSAIDTPDVRPDSGSPMDTEWPPAGTNWPSFADEPVPAQEEPRWPSFAEEPPAAAQDEPRWPSFSTEPPAAKEEPRWPSFASEPPPAQEAPRWPSFAEEPYTPNGNSSYNHEAPSWPSFAEQPPQNGDSAFTAFGRREYTSQDMTGPLPVVRNSPIEEEDGEEFLPIFSSVGSDWFRRPEPPEFTPQPPAEPEPLPQPMAQPMAEPIAADTVDKPALPQRRPGQSGAGASWSSPADTGWQAAQAAAQPSQGGTTASGLPRRVPKANLVPGTASLAEPQATSPAPQISPERLRSRLSSFQQGVRQGRAFTRGEENEEDK
ncbi:sensor histidine kinase [Nonomuraea sediminis]|uniref:sensor histidine kinase n=1 Tax=Nonomuraea sediminis TaxID=2835864 RepID=UPI001BDCEEF2|nr:nitrate- and nitrite sensing domain-containing protein [Nonomuraea sediminis]